MRARLAAPVALAVLLTGLGGGSAVASTGSSVSAGPSAGTAVAAAVDLSAARRGLPGKLDLSVLSRKTGLAAVAKKTATVDWDLGGSNRVHGVVRYGAKPAMMLTMRVNGMNIREVMVGGVLYISTGQAIKGKHWIKIDPKGTDPLSKAFGPLVKSISQVSSPDALATPYRGVTAVATKGPKMEGVPTTIYTVTMNAKKIRAALATLPPALRSLVAAQAASITSIMTKYYVDSSWLIHKTVSVSVVKGKRVSQTMVFSRWGKPVSIVAPPASDVAAAGSLS